MAVKALPTFEVSREGLAAQLARRPKAFIVAELAQNAWDENSTRVDILLERHSADLYRLVVEDDNPEGFADLSHAYTLFADSAKKDDPEKRGRFNLGEKLVIALCDQVKIITTKGSILFTKAGRYPGTTKRTKGSMFEAIIPMTEAEAAECERFVQTLIPPGAITTTFNFAEVARRVPVTAFSVSLRTEIADADGRLKPTTRKTRVEVFEPLTGETATLYELGIPVVDTGDRYHVNVCQKVPLNTDRDNVPPAYLRDVRAAVLNHVAPLLSPEDAKATWVTQAMEDETVDPEAVKTAFSKRFGEKAVIHDPNDLEANKIAAQNGYTVVPGGALSKAAWKHVKEGGVALPAGKVTPSPKPYSSDGDDLKLMDPDHYPGYIANTVDFAERYGEKLLGRPVTCRIANDPSWAFNATYGQGFLTFNLGRLGHRWFEHIDAATLALCIHEFAHEFSGDHLSREYHKALEVLGARSTMLALAEPEFFAECAVEVTV